MKAIQCFSSLPVQQGRLASGHFGNLRKFELPLAVKLCMKLSALQFRRTNGPITLYTDSAMKEYLESQGLLSCWNEINTDLLDNFYAEHPEINHSVFWSAGKFACYLNEQAPFVCIDTDLVLWQKLNVAENLDFAFTHWESIDPDDESYPNLNKIKRPENFTLLQAPTSDVFNSSACNMAVTYFGNDDFKKEFSELAIKFMSKNPVKPEGRYATPEILYVEQRLPLALAIERGLNYSPLINLVWSPKKFQITQAPPEFKYWFFSDLNTSKILTHLWFHKKFLAENKRANKEYCERLRLLIDEAEDAEFYKE